MEEERDGEREMRTREEENICEREEEREIE
jgi:hypothetical protein